MKPLLSGICFGSLVAIKYYALILLVYFVIEKEWRLVMSSVFVVLLVIIASVAFMGWDVHKEFFFSILRDHLMSQFSTQDPFSSSFQSWDSLLRRLFVYDAVRNPAPLLAVSEMYPLLKGIIISVLVLIAGFAIVKLQKQNHPHKGSVSLGVLGILGLLIAPGTATYHYVLFWLPLGLLLKFFRETREKRLLYVALALYSAIGVIPLSIFQRFEGRGLLTVFAYPRLFLVLLLFTVAISGARKAAWDSQTTSA